MIETVTLHSAHLFGDALADQHRFRYQQFVVRAGWSVPHVDGMEYATVCDVTADAKRASFQQKAKTMKAVTMRPSMRWHGIWTRSCGRR